MPSWLITTLAIIAAILLFVNMYPPMGARQSSASRSRLQRSKQYTGTTFANTLQTRMTITSMNNSNSNQSSLLLEFMKGNPQSRPSKPLAVMQPQLRPAGLEPSITWFGHSALMLQLEGLTLLIDPMLGKTPSPFPIFGKGRYSGKPPITAEQLPEIDAIILSHDHYDHLDYGSIRKLKHKTKRFIVPLGVSAHLIRWGVNPEIIEEYDWWDELELGGIRLACTPARHFSGRSLTDRNATLWCSWVIRSSSASIYFSGDGGYGPHFKEIGQKYGPFDLTLMECGQYNDRWAPIHMKPEETVQAHIDVRGRVLIPIHWGAFTLSLHSWTDPAERVSAAALKHNVQLCTPQIGQTVAILAEEYPNTSWWKAY